MPKSSPESCNCTTELKSLLKEVAKLKKELASMQKAITKLTAPGKVRATKAVVDSLQVIDPDGKVVASIDNKGNLICLSVWASVGKNVRGVFLDGQNRRVSAKSLELIGASDKKPGLVADCQLNGGKMSLRSLEPGSKQALDLQSNGAPLIAYEKTKGSGVVKITTNSLKGGSIELDSSDAASRASAKLSISHLNGSGSLTLKASDGTIIGKLP